MEQKINPKIQYLTDDLINLFAGEKKLTTWDDITARPTKVDLQPISGGVLDPEIFGSCFRDQCNCGKVHGVIGKRCIICGSTILPEEEAWTRYAKIELPFLYCPNLRKKEFTKFINGSEIKLHIDITEETANIIKGGNSFFLYDFCQFNWDEENSEVIVTDKITDHNKCSFEGLLMIIIDHYPQLLDTFRSFINSNILVLPVIARAPHWDYTDGTRKLMNHEITIAYRSILYAIEECKNKAMSPDWYTTPMEISLYYACMREFIASCMDKVCQLLRPSKENFARSMQSHRLVNSGRCTIVPAPDLKVNEVYVPRHLMYECCRTEFINYLIKVIGMSQLEARSSYETNAGSKEIQDLFERYINEANGGEGKYVVINRNPTLYELGMMACKVKLTNDYTIGLPLLLCSPFGGDYDGDTFSFYVIPDEITDEVVSKMSPENLVYYKKSQSPLFTPSHEIMGGIITGTRKCYSTENIFTDTTDKIEERPLEEGKSIFIPYYESYEDAYKAKRKTRGFKWQTVININGTETTLGLTRFSELFMKDLNEYLNDGKQNLTSSDIPILYETINQQENRLELIQAVQEFALTIATTSGATAPKLSELHASLDKSYLEEIKKIEENETLSDREKDVAIRDIYSKFMYDVEHGYVTDENGEFVLDENGEKIPRVADTLKLKISDSSRAKVNQLLNIITEQLTVGPDHVAHVTTTSLINGMSPTDYTRHSIENRGTQDIKVSATPASGYTTRQLVFLGKGFRYIEEPDPQNRGVDLELNKCAGRTRVDGTIITKEEAARAKKGEMVKVRSIVTSKFTEREVVSKDCVSNLNKWNEGDNIGVSLLSSLTEGLTQSGLSLKHGGRLFETDKLAGLVAPFDCKVQLTDLWIVLISDNGETVRYPKSPSFVINYSESGKYKKGQLVGVLYRQFTPSYRLDCVIKLLGAAKSSSTKRAINNKVLETECYAYAPGKIHYIVKSDNIVGIEIGEYTYTYDPDAMYFLPEGTYVEFAQRFCTGTLDVVKAIKSLNNRVKVFRLFFNQFNELIPNISPELIEFVYALIVLDRNGRIIKKTVLTAILDAPGFLNKVSFRNSKETLKKIGPEGIEFISDASSDILLPMLVGSQIFK